MKSTQPRLGLDDKFAPQLADRLLVKLTLKALCQAFIAERVNGVRSLVELYMRNLGATQSEIDAVMLIIMDKVSDNCLLPIHISNDHYSIFLDET